jgi:DNA-binding NarL/FixJ family response regulator
MAAIVRLVLCDNHEMFLDALALALTIRGHDIVAICRSQQEAVDQVISHAPDVCVLDAILSDGSGLDAATALRRAGTRTRTVMLTGAVTPAVWQAYDERLLDAMVNKTCDIGVLEKAIGDAVQGRRSAVGWSRPAVLHQRTSGEAAELTDRERQVLDYLVFGASTQTIADELGITGNTVRTHVQKVLQKLGVHGRGKAARVAVELSLCTVSAAAV